MRSMTFRFCSVGSWRCRLNEDFPSSRWISDHLDFSEFLCDWPSVASPFSAFRRKWELSDPLPFSGFWAEWTSTPWFLSKVCDDWRTSDPLALLLLVTKGRTLSKFWSSLASWFRRSFRKLSRVVNFDSALVVEFATCCAHSYNLHEYV